VFVFARGDEREELGLVLFQLAPFLKLYVHYISKFDSATKALTELSKKDKKFEAALKKFEASPACASLSVSNHMLEPVQRIPRYRMLLVDYLKHLPSDSQDYKPSIKALELISEAADRANDEIKHFENLNQVLSIQRSLQDYNDPLVTPGRTFLKKGKLYKSAGKTTHLKMFFLFSDILIYANIVAGGNYKCKNVLPILGMKVFGQQFTHGSLAFHVISKTRSLTLFAQNEAEKQEWVEALEAAINDSRARKKSFRRRSTVVSINDRWFGVHSPVMLPCDSASRCMQCDAAFSFRNRKNNCKACGKVVCSHCSKHKTYLLYKGKEDKVCVNCYDKANAHGLSDIVAPSGPPDDLTPPQVDPFESEVIYEGHLLYQLTDGNDWEKFWFQLKSNCVLYKFTDIENVQTLDEVVSLSDCEVDQDEGTIITLTHSKGSFRVKTLEEGDAERWMQSITRAKDISSTFTLSL
jgi:FYVE/RhoGEF/PH domain-containing protein 5/6